MKPLFIGAVVSLLTASAFGGEAPNTHLTTNILEQTTILMEKAVDARDSAGLLTHIASNAVFTLSFPKNPEIPKMILSKKEYALHLQQSWDTTKTITIRRLKTKYEISDDGQSATSTSTFTQTATFTHTDQILILEGTQVAGIELIDGIPQATRIDMTASVNIEF
jgi:hypothetical protein